MYNMYKEQGGFQLCGLRTTSGMRLYVGRGSGELIIRRLPFSSSEVLIFETEQNFHLFES